MKALVIYYSVSNHTASVAKLIAEKLNVETEAIHTKDAYGDYIIDKTKREIENKDYPSILPLSHNFDEYDTVILGTPTWWVSPSSPIYSLIKTGVLKGKTIYPFITTGFDVSGVEEKLRELLPDSKVMPSLIVSYTNAFRETGDGEILDWASKIK